ncbi:winged helix-turn-helix transcriptional regulator [Nordella sp. HKS 07]|uniref:ArsR/SmtB family transcription factor n=1 Tax=Nordella sp. HKS 07 TaxID=2712222 RepID=UPI0013E1C359|nr:metalloregulator ArsR/SmtB family transcription factor [Nordella sp. HKS 07]QIG47546.1 winged helix-turn-helix transcriptional regulator [Nordella sp. HKS 07]
MDSFTAISDPTRRRIIGLLAERELSAGALAENFQMTAPAVSQHLKALKEARLVQVRVDGQRRIYSLNPQGLSEIDGWLDTIRRFWRGRLDALEEALRQPDPLKKDNPK